MFGLHVLLSSCFPDTGEEVAPNCDRAHSAGACTLFCRCTGGEKPVTTRLFKTYKAPGDPPPAPSVGLFAGLPFFWTQVVHLCTKTLLL